MMQNQKHVSLIEAIHIVKNDRHKMVVVLGAFASGKTALLKDIAAELNAVYLNLNLSLTEELQKIPRSNYADGVTVHRLIDEICDQQSPNGEILLIDNVEILFSPELGKVNPIDTFKRVSRQRVVVLSLPARRQGNYAEYSNVGREDHMLMALEDYYTIEMK